MGLRRAPPAIPRQYGGPAKCDDTGAPGQDETQEIFTGPISSMEHLVNDMMESTSNMRFKQRNGGRHRKGRDMADMGAIGMFYSDGAEIGGTYWQPARVPRLSFALPLRRRIERIAWMRQARSAKRMGERYRSCHRPRANMLPGYAAASTSAAPRFAKAARLVSQSGSTSAARAWTLASWASTSEQ